MRKFATRLGVACTLASTLVLAPSVNARTLSIGTNPQGSVSYASGAAIADVVGDAMDTSFTVVPQGGPTAIIPAMTAGEFDFAFANIVAAVSAQQGTGPFKGRKFDSIRVAAVVYPLDQTIFVRKDSKIKNFADLGGQRVASAFKSQANLVAFMKAALGAAGLTYDDVKQVPVQNGVQAVDQLIDGGLDATVFSVASGVIQKADAVIGVRGLSLPDDQVAQNAVKQFTPGVSIAQLPAGSYPGLAQPTNILRAPFVVLTDSRVDDDTVYKVVKALAENKAKLAESAADFEGMDTAAMGQSTLPLPYHPGAVKYYKEHGMWH